jgi:hypothetical protein
VQPFQPLRWLEKRLDTLNQRLSSFANTYHIRSRPNYLGGTNPQQSAKSLRPRLSYLTQQYAGTIGKAMSTSERDMSPHTARE